MQNALKVIAQEDKHGEETGAREQRGEECTTTVPVPDYPKG